MRDTSSASIITDAPDSTVARASTNDPPRLPAEPPEHTSFLEKIIETIPTPVFFRDPEQGHMTLNRAFTEAFGSSGGKIIDDMTSGAPFGGLASHTPSGGAGAGQREFSFIHADGSLHHAICNMAVYPRADGAQAGFVGVISDITAHRRMEELRRSEEMYRTLFEDSNDGFFQASVNGIISDVSAAVVALFGYASADEMKGMNCADICSDPAQRQRFRAEMAGRGRVKDFEGNNAKNRNSLISGLISRFAL